MTRGAARRCAAPRHAAQRRATLRRAARSVNAALGAVSQRYKHNIISALWAICFMHCYTAVTRTWENFRIGLRWGSMHHVIGINVH